MKKTYKKTLTDLILNNVYLEDIYGNKATVYHRTRIENLINKVYDEGLNQVKVILMVKGFIVHTN
jgi:hypothetical protein